MKRTIDFGATCFFAVEIVFFDSSQSSFGNQQRSDMPFYHCLFGAGADTLVQEEGCFFITDNKDRLWFCKEITEKDREEPAYATQFLRMGFLAHKIGIKEMGMMFQGNADDEDDLKNQLSDRS